MGRVPCKYRAMQEASQNRWIEKNFYQYKGQLKRPEASPCREIEKQIQTLEALSAFIFWSAIAMAWSAFTCVVLYQMDIIVLK